MKFRLTPFAAALGALCAVPGLALAQEATTPSPQQSEPAREAPAAPATTAPADAAVELPAVPVTAAERRERYATGVTSVGGKLPAELRDVPQVVNVVTEDVIEAQGAASLKEALRYVPGITLAAGEGGNIGDNISLRGFSARTDVYLDGFRDRGQYTRDTFHLQAVEVLKGPASMLFGRGSTGGVINQVSKQPSLTPSAEVSATLGTDDYYRATADLNQPTGEQAAFRIAAMGQAQHSTRDFVQGDSYGVAPSLRFGIGSPTEITLSALLQRSEELPDYGFPMIQLSESDPLKKPAKAPHDRFYGYRDDYFDQEVELFTASVKHQINGALSLRNRTQYTHYSTEASPTPLGTLTKTSGSGVPTQSTPLDQIQAQRQDRDRTLRDTSLYNQTDLVANFATGAIKHTVIGGAELGVDSHRFTRYLWDPTNVPINLGKPVNGTRSGTRFRSQTQATDADTVAFYLNEQADLGEQWKLVLGLRHDKFHAESSIVNFAKDGTISAPAQPSPHTDTMLSSRAGLLFQPTRAQSYYVSYGTSFNPSAETVTQSATSSALDAEKNRSYEVGGKWDLLEGDLLLGAALFRVEKTDARTTDAATGTVSLDGDVRVQGLELSAVGNITPAWQLFGGYVLLDSEVLESNDTQKVNVNGDPNVVVVSKGKDYQNTPRDQVTLWTTYAFLPHWETGAGAIYSSERYVNNFETAQIDGYTRYDATLAYRQPRYDLRLNLLNATDKEYFEGASGGRAIPARGRTALMTVSYRFGK